VTFYAWLCSEQAAYQFLLRAYEKLRIPQSTNKLCKLLRYLDTHKSRHSLYGPTRTHLKIAHRAWRAYRKPLEKGYVIARSSEPHFDVVAELENVEIDFQHDYPESDILHGLKRTEDVTFTIDFVSSENGFEELARFCFDNYILQETGISAPERDTWSRVYRHWYWKHRPLCRICHVEEAPVVAGVQLVCRACELGEYL
jgi:hypothetical protein